MANAASTEAMVDKIRKLLAKAEGTNNEYEAAACAAMASKLANQYQIDIEKIRQQDRSGVTFGQTEVRMGRRGAAQWHSSLCSEVAKANFCRTVRWTRVRADYYNYGVIFGEPHNVEIVKALYEYLEREIRRLAAKSWSNDGQYRYGANKHNWETSFAMGAVAVVSRRLKLMRSELDRELRQAEITGECTALMVVADSRVQAAYDLAFQGLTTSKPRAKVNRSAYVEGQRAGQGLAINPMLKEG